MKMTFEITVDVPDGKPICGVSLLISRDAIKWEQILLFAFDRPTRVRDGKHIKFDGEKTATIVKVGE